MNLNLCLMDSTRRLVKLNGSLMQAARSFAPSNWQFNNTIKQQYALFIFLLGACFHGLQTKTG
jgi:hypothetical protein